MPGCYPGYFGLPCTADDQCVGDLKCTAPSNAAAQKLCTTLCRDDGDCGANRWVAGNPPGSVSVGAGIGVQSFYAVSTNRGASFTEQLASSASQMPQYEQFGNRDIPFFGDYNYISAVGNIVLMDWTDQRDPAVGPEPGGTRPGIDPRYTNGDGTDGFDVWQCRVQNSAGTWSADNCPNASGLDQNIFGFVLG